jgi:hypothetical protein
MPLLARVADDRTLVDPRTLHGEGDVDAAIAVLVAVLGAAR